MSQCEKCGQDVPMGTPFTLREKIERLNPDTSWTDFVEKLKAILLELEAKNWVTIGGGGGIPSFPTPFVPYQPPTIPAIDPWSQPNFPRITCVNAEGKTTGRVYPVPDGTGFSGDPS